MSSVSYAENRTDAVAEYTLAGPMKDTARWALEGADAGNFMISSAGVLTFRTTPNYESPADADKDNTYMVTLRANDGTYTDTHEVTVTVTNVEEPGTVTLSAAQPVVGVELTASVEDPDGMVTGETWQWARGAGGDYENIGEATSKTYTPVAEDAGKQLRATAGYDDGEGSGKTAMATSANVVTAAADEPGTVTLSADPQVGVELTASLADPDGIVGDVTWQWASSDISGGTYTNISEAMSDSYTPVADDVGKHLRATASYTDGQGSGKTAMATSANVVTAADEPGTVTLSADPQVGVELTASLADPDGIVGDVTWQWASSDISGGTYTNISEAMSDSYTPVADDVGKHLRATASYTDGEGSGKTAMATSAKVVTAGDPLLARYDTDQNGEISQTEVIAAINDYLYGEGANAITKDQAIAVINLYLFQS